MDKEDYVEYVTREQLIEAVTVAVTAAANKAVAEIIRRQNTRIIG